MTSGWRAAESAESIRFEKGRVFLELGREGDRLWVSGFGDAGGAEADRFSFGTGSTLWELDLRDEAGYCYRPNGSTGDRFSYEAGPDLRLKWTDLAEGSVDVTVTVTASETEPTARWSLAIGNGNENLAVWEITFPSFLDVLGPTGDHTRDELIVPEGFGARIPDPIARDQDAVWPAFRYPNNVVAMQYLALKSGPVAFYIDVQDPKTRRKNVDYVPDRRTRTIPMRITTPVDDPNRHRSRVETEYTTTTAVIRGGWFEAADTYGTWARSQRWAQRTVAERDDIPHWARSVPFWIRIDVADHHGKPVVTSGEMEKIVDLCARFRKAVGREIGGHVYKWHDHPFDLQYPDYRPRPHFDSMVAGLQDAGIRVMPYINARLFDPDNPDWSMDRARRYTTKEAGAKLFSAAERVTFESYNSGTAMAVMCPATAYWQDKIASVIERMVRELGVDGVYLDQIGAAWPAICMDPSHGHTTGNGDWWVEGYREMFARIRARLADTNREVYFTTESNAEPYLNIVGGMLMVNSVRSCVVPAFQVVYGGRSLLFGRAHSVRTRPEFRVIAAQDIVWGCQAGWINLDDVKLLLTPEYASELAFVRDLCELYERSVSFFTSGRMIAPPEVDGREIEIALDFNGHWEERLSSIIASRWRSDRRIATLLVNADDTRQSVSVSGCGSDASVWAASGTNPNWTVVRDEVRIDLPPGAVVEIRGVLP